MITCWNCSQPGHVAADCTWRAELSPSAQVSPAWHPPVPPRTAGTDPTPAYLEQRQRLGMPGSGPAVLSVACPWCKAPRWRRCVNTALGSETDPHYARQEAAGVAQPSVRLADLALRQVAESRAARLAV